jgi:S-adenosylmethionine decarboxylase
MLLKNDSDFSVKDYFQTVDGVEFAGTHIILDVWGAKKLTESGFMEAVFNNCICSSDATLLHMHVHCFESSGGISGVAVLAESHISVHTWPERDYAAFDIFMCGESKPEESVKVIIDAFRPSHHALTKMRRGIVETGAVNDCSIWQYAHNR